MDIYTTLPGGVRITWERYREIRRAHLEWTDEQIEDYILREYERAQGIVRRDP